ncbi:MAG: Fic family protein [Thermoplasmata archaeon]|nr:Fic family protein [Thermoplasmata archaeon]
MAFTEIKEKKGSKYYYRTRSVRNGKKVGKKRVYLGTNLNKRELKKAEREADVELGVLDALLTAEEIEILSEVQREYSKQPKRTLENRYETFISLFTHDSTAIEGNTLTLQETASLLFDEIAPSKNMREINEVLDHKKAFDHLLEYDGEITKKFICSLHRLMVQDTLDDGLEDQIGQYRSLQVYIRGVDWIPAPPESVGKDMGVLLSWYAKNKGEIHPLIAAIYFHVGFELIHPFVDGNGRVGRLLMNFILHKNGYPMVNIPNLQRNRYYAVLEEAQVNGNLRPFIEFIIELYQESKVLL